MRFAVETNQSTLIASLPLEAELRSPGIRLEPSLRGLADLDSLELKLRPCFRWWEKLVLPATSNLFERCNNCCVSFEIADIRPGHKIEIFGHSGERYDVRGELRERAPSLMQRQENPRELRATSKIFSSNYD